MTSNPRLSETGRIMTVEFGPCRSLPAPLDPLELVVLDDLTAKLVRGARGHHAALAVSSPGMPSVLVDADVIGDIPFPPQRVECRVRGAQRGHVQLGSIRLGHSGRPRCADSPRRCP